MLAERAKGVVAALGRGADWYDHFDLSRTGFRRSFGVAALSIPMAMVVAKAVEVERARLLGEAARDVPWLPFAGVVAMALLAFPFVAVLCASLFERSDRLPAWVVVRHWTLVLGLMVPTVLFALSLVGALPYAVANGILFVGMFALLAADVRLAQRIGGLGLGASVLVASSVMALTLSLLLAGLLLYIG